MAEKITKEEYENAIEVSGAAYDVILAYERQEGLIPSPERLVPGTRFFFSGIAYRKTADSVCFDGVVCSEAGDTFETLQQTIKEEYGKAYPGSSIVLVAFNSVMVTG